MIIELKQRHLEAFEAEYFRLMDGKRGKNTDNGATVRAAQKAGWFVTDPGDVGELTGKRVGELAAEINRVYVEAITLDPN
jgi:hypothetical protein